VLNHKRIEVSLQGISIAKEKNCSGGFPWYYAVAVREVAEAFFPEG
jgi:hypothetical protein